MKASHPRARAGFSLAEITISIAIIAAVLLPLIAILSQGSGIVNESSDRFATTRIVQSIQSEMRYSQESNAFFIGSESSSQSEKLSDVLLSASGGGAIYLGFDRSARLIREVSAGEFLDGINSDALSADGTGILYLVELRLSKESKRPSSGAPSLFSLEISVEQPAFTSHEMRTKERLRTLLAGQ